MGECPTVEHKVTVGLLRADMRGIQWHLSLANADCICPGIRSMSFDKTFEPVCICCKLLSCRHKLCRKRMVLKASFWSAGRREAQHGSGTRLHPSPTVGIMRTYFDDHHNIAAMQAIPQFAASACLTMDVLD